MTQNAGSPSAPGAFILDAGMRWGIAVVVGIVGMASSCSPVPEVNHGYTPSEYRAVESASSEYRRDVGGKGVYEGLYENPDAIRHYCRSGEGDPLKAQEECNYALYRVYRGRVNSQYRFFDWDEVRNYCDLKYPECETLKGMDGAIRSSHITGAQRQNHLTAQEIDRQRQARIAVEEEVREKFLKAFQCSTMSEEALAACRGERVVRCKTQMEALGLTPSSSTVCYESGGKSD